MAKAEKPTARYNPPPPGGFSDLCGVCRRPIEPDGKCADCGGWPYTVWLVDRTTGEPLRDPFTRRRKWNAIDPQRACPTCGGPIDTSGVCRVCEAQVGPGLIHPTESPVRGIWIEAEGEGPFPIRFLSPDQAKARLREIMAQLKRLPMLYQDFHDLGPKSPEKSAIGAAIEKLAEGAPDTGNSDDGTLAPPSVPPSNPASTQHRPATLNKGNKGNKGQTAPASGLSLADSLAKCTPQVPF